MSIAEKINILTKQQLDNIDLKQRPNELFGVIDEPSFNVDSSLDINSENAIQNKAVASALDDINDALQNTVTIHTTQKITGSKTFEAESHAISVGDVKMQFVDEGEDRKELFTKVGTNDASSQIVIKPDELRIDVYDSLIDNGAHTSVLYMGPSGIEYNGSEILTLNRLSNHVFVEQIGISNENEGEINYIKHINNNFLISTSDGENIINIDEQLKTFNFYNKPIALESYVTDNFVSYTKTQTLTDAQKEVARNNLGVGAGGSSSGTTVTVGGEAQSTWDADSKVSVEKLYNDSKGIINYTDNKSVQFGLFTTDNVPRTAVIAENESLVLASVANNQLSQTNFIVMPNGFGAQSYNIAESKMVVCALEGATFMLQGEGCDIKINGGSVALQENYKTVTQAEYDGFVSAGTVDPNTYYFIKEE